MMLCVLCVCVCVCVCACVVCVCVCMFACMCCVCVCVCVCVCLLGQDAVNTTLEKFCRPFPATVVHRKSILDMHTIATNADPWNGVETFCSLITTPTYPHLELGIISRILIIAVNV